MEFLPSNWSLRKIIPSTIPKQRAWIRGTDLRRMGYRNGNSRNCSSAAGTDGTSCVLDMELPKAEISSIDIEDDILDVEEVVIPFVELETPSVQTADTPDIWRKYRSVFMLMTQRSSK